ncbi:MAG: putative PEP-binding protein, partial [Candidatus Adiutrix sp.]
NIITEEEALLRIEPEHLTQLLLPSFHPEAKREVMATGLPASPGAAVGQAVFTASEAVIKADSGVPVILVRLETSPEDINGMFKAEGILTARGGMTSHAAVVARGMGKTCVAGANDITVDYERKQFRTKNGDVIKEGDWLSLDGSRGEILKGQLATIEGQMTPECATLLKWAGKYKKMAVRTNADTPHDSQVARDLGAEGIGLCRTEHMFFEGDRIIAMREVIMADDAIGRQKALAKLLPMQREDFYGIFKVMNGCPVTIRTLDPPLHEFLPHTDDDIKALCQVTGRSPAEIKSKAESLEELNPMLGHRGCRLGIVYPEITQMQARAIFEAAALAMAEKIKVLPEIMIPLVGHEKEFTLQKTIVDQVAKEVMAEKKVRIKYLVGTMIELPRAALVAHKIVAGGAEFFSFGTNDLTQTTYGLSRDDSGKFLPNYLAEGIWEQDPFVTIDLDGVGFLVETAITRGRSVAPSLKIGICGEHGGDPVTVKFCCRANMDYVSCSPFRVPLARLAAAQEAICTAKLSASKPEKKAKELKKPKESEKKLKEAKAAKPEKKAKEAKAPKPEKKPKGGDVKKK